MKADFKGKAALVTGATGSIGKGIARELMAGGASVFITDIDQDAVDKAAAELSCMGLAADIVKEDQVRAVTEAALAANGRIDILVNVAGIVGQGKVEDLTEAEWDQMFAVNCKGTFFFVKYVVPGMKKNNYGKIINFSSKSGKTGSALMSHYSAAKGAIIALTQSLAFELADYKINVNCLCPGITDHSGVWDRVSEDYIKNLNLSREEVIDKFTSKIPLKRLALVGDVTAATCFLASEGADYMTGQAINITGGREMH